MRIRVQAQRNAQSYAVDIRPGILRDAGTILHTHWPKRQIIVLTNRTVYPLWYKHFQRSLSGAGIKARPIVIRDGERYKNPRTYHEIISQMIEHQADRHSVLVTFGGGVIGDLGGFVAATYMRGIDLVHIPTTLVAQIDSSIGGKVALDHQQAKNLVGCFYNPRLVLTDPDMLSTLSKRDVLNGLFEAVKIALVGNRRLYTFIRDNSSRIQNGDRSVIAQLVGRCVKEKVRAVTQDPFDRHRRMILNFGHTFGHALETAEKYKRISHGQAIGWGMLVALRISEIFGHCDPSTSSEIVGLVRRLLGRKRLGRINPDGLWKTMTLDKKARAGAVRFVLLKSVGRPVIENINRRTFIRALETI